MGELDACTAVIVLFCYFGELIQCGRIKTEVEVLVSEENIHIFFFDKLYLGESEFLNCISKFYTGPKLKGDNITFP